MTIFRPRRICLRHDKFFPAYRQAGLAAVSDLRRGEYAAHPPKNDSAHYFPKNNDTLQNSTERK